MSVAILIALLALILAVVSLFVASRYLLPIAIILLALLHLVAGLGK